MNHDESNPVSLGPPFRLILSSPRSGSTILLRLINLTCKESGLPVRCSGDYHPSVYESLVKLHKGLFSDTIFNKRTGLNGPENPCYYNPKLWLGSGMTEDYWRRKYFGYWFLRPAFNIGDMFVHKTTNLGLPCAFGGSGPDSISDQFIRLVKDCFQDGIKIIFVTRDRQGIIKSLKERPDCIHGYDSMDIIESSLDEQQEFFARHRTPFDYVITHQEILDDPVKCCQKLGFTANEEFAKEIVKNVL